NLSAFDLDMELTAPGSGVTALFGPSGSGKTTFLRLIAGLSRPDSGFFKVNGEVWQDSDSALFMPPHKRPVGFVFQDSRLFSHLTVRENLLYGYNRLPVERRIVKIDDVIRWLSLESLLARYPSMISGGQRQRVSIGRALLRSPRLLLFDEPLASLDSEGKSEILHYLETLKDELPAPSIYVTHSMDEVARVADHMALVRDGKIIRSGPVAQMFTSLDSPLALDEEAGAALDAVVIGHDSEYHLTTLKFAGGIMSVSNSGLSVGTRVRVRVIASDVSLSLNKPEGSSVLNVLEAVVTGVAEKSLSQVIVGIDAGGAGLLARITKKSAFALGIRPGVKVYALVKSVAVIT
ncbi:MAG: molybdenum ABC transporter ATP-binding protein, partial [Nitrospinae bacterium]|nr:molybdenum ABC transporter ATP-binding protein [Nitrospinota bacterium]